MENQLQLALSSRPTTSFTSLLESQKELFSSQIDQLQNIVAHQCNLTGVNPLSQEMAAGALSIKIAGKRPRDLLNPKAIKYMQSVFSIKDAINKKETREISALFGVTVTQVRDFFTTQRTRVRKLLRLSREKASKSDASNEGHCETPLSSDPGLPTEPAPLDSVAPTCTEEGPSCSTQDEVLTGIDERERHFLDTIFTLMRKEETFSGQVKLMDGILEVQNPSVLHWFLTKGGVMILATWLSQAAIEEQTSVLHVILKVLCHLPLHQALPVHMSAILQSVNRLRFYRTSDISNRARILLAKWSKMFARSQALKKRNGIKSASDVQDELLLKQSIGEVMGNEIWNSKVDDFEVSHANLSETSEHLRKLDSPQPIKLLTASSDDPNKKLSRGVLASKTRERRKVQLMEQPSQRTTGRSLPVARSTPANQARPLSADDIQKAKMRAQFMQSKYGKSNNDDSSQVKPEAPKRITSPEDGGLNGALKLLNWPKLDEREKLDNVTLKRSNLEESHRKLSLDVEEPPWKRCRRMQIPWQKPPEFKISDTWIIIAGDDSKEVAIQNNRIRRERETIYRTVQEIPLNPKEPWDIEMDPDDTLTTEIPIEQLPDPESAETVVTRVDKGKTEVAAVSASTSSNQGPTTIPDFDLLAELLKSPEVVFALSNLSSEETVKLLDMIKKNGVNSLNSLVDLGRNAQKNVEVSLPSPTPSSEPGPSGTKHDFTKNPFSQRSLMAIPDSYGAAQLAALVRSQENIQASSMVQHQQITSTTMLAPQQQLTITPQLAQQLSLLQAAASSGSFEQQQHHGPSQINHSLNQTVLVNSLNAQLSASESSVNRSNYSVYGSTEYNLHGANAAAASRMRAETSGNIRSSPTPMSMQMQMPIANVQQRNINLPSPQMAVSPTPPRLHLQAQSQPGYVAEPWGGAMPGSYSNRGYQDNAIPNHYNAYVAGHVGHGTQQAVWRGNNHMDEPGFESWSPDNSPVRHHQYVPTWNHAEPRMNMSNNNNYRQDRMNMSDNNYRPDRSAAPQQHPGYYSGYRGRDAGGNGRWGERRR